MKTTKALHHGYRFPAVIITLAVRWRSRSRLDLRDVEALLFKHDLIASCETIRTLVRRVRRGLRVSRQAGSVR